MKVDRNVNTRGKHPARAKNLKETIADAVELSVDGVRGEAPKMIEQQFRKRVPSRRRDVDRLGSIQLDSLGTRVSEFLSEGDSREDLLEVLSRVGSTGFDIKIQFRIDDA